MVSQMGNGPPAPGLAIIPNRRFNGVFNMKWSASLLAASLSIALSTNGQAHNSAGGTIDLPPPPTADVPSLQVAAFEITGFQRQQFTVERVRGKILINGIEAASDIVEQSLPAILLIEEFDNIVFADSRAFRHWARSLHGTRTYTYDNVFIRNSGGTTATTPLVLLQNEQREAANIQWERWLVEKRAIAAAEQREFEARRSEQVRYDAFQVLVTQQAASAARLAGIESFNSRRTDSWLVYLVPEKPIGVDSGPTLRVGGGGLQLSNAAFISQLRGGFTVRVNGDNSRIATNNALAQYPGYTIGGAARSGY